jgi:hypothetical protein
LKIQSPAKYKTKERARPAELIPQRTHTEPSPEKGQIYSRNSKESVPGHLHSQNEEDGQPAIVYINDFTTPRGQKLTPSLTAS